jgi:hypothetical protein
LAARATAPLLQQHTMLTRIYSAFLTALFLLNFAAANVEKQIFLGPPPSTVTLGGVGSHLPQLAPSEHCSNCRAIRTRLSTSFSGRGAEQWMKVDGLEEGKRYEVRICWAATVLAIRHIDPTLDSRVELLFHANYGFSNQRISPWTFILLSKCWRNRCWRIYGSIRPTRLQYRPTVEAKFST